MRCIFDLALQDYGGRAIGTILKNEQVLCPSYRYAELGYNCIKPVRDKYVWPEQTIRKMLHDRAYTGAIVGNKHPTVSFELKKRIRSEPENLVIVEGIHEPIIDKETFETVQRTISVRHQNVDLIPKGILNGYLKCADCGKSITCNSKKKGKNREFYCCRTYRNNGREYCTHHFLPSKEAQETILQDIREKANLALRDDGKLLRELCAMAAHRKTADRKELERQIF